MRFPALASVLIFASCASAPAALQDASPVPYRSSHLDLHLGGRALDKDDWDPVEDQGTIGIDFVHEGLDSAIGFEVGMGGNSLEGGWREDVSRRDTSNASRGSRILRGRRAVN